MRLIVALLVAAMAGPAQAQSPPPPQSPGRVQIFGAGLIGCGEVVAAIEAERAAWVRREQTQTSNQSATMRYTHLVGFLSGMMSGVNWAGTQDTFSPGDLLSRMLFIERHCRSSPLDNFMNAIEALSQEEQRRR